MRGLQLTILISTAVVLLGTSAWALWHTWSEQELGPAPVPPSTPLPERIAILLTVGPLRGHEPGDLDPLRTAEGWRLHLPGAGAPRSRSAALGALRAALARHLAERARSPGDLRARVAGEAGVPAADLVAVAEALRALGLAQVDVDAS